jgi:hypothetical protein
MNKAATVAMLLLLAACGSSPNVGAACSGNGDCSDGLTCSTAFAGGYCTRACPTAGATGGCPDVAICDAVTGAGNVCVKICQTTTDCRSPLECNGVTSSNIKACKPK